MPQTSPRAPRIIRPQVSLDDVLITPQLHTRNIRATDLRRENAALHNLVRMLLRPPQELMNKLLQTALELCAAGSAGISVIDSEQSQVFKWVAMAGKYADYVGGTTPRDFSPCGTTAAAGSPQLFYLPARLFTYFEQATPSIVEGLVIPFEIPNRPTGTIWIVLHDEETRFDLEDARIMTALSGYAAVAVHRLLTERGAIL